MKNDSTNSTDRMYSSKTARLPTERRDSQTKIRNRAHPSYEQPDGEMMIQVLTNEGTEEQVKPAHGASIARDSTLVQRGPSGAANGWNFTVRKRVKRLLDTSGTFEEGVMTR